MKIIDKIVVSGKEKGRYKAFPTVSKCKNIIIIAYRDGDIDFTKPHGKNGCVKISKTKDLKHFQEIDTPFCYHELDAILSNIDERLFLLTRSYEYKKMNDVYMSKFDCQDLPNRRSKIAFDSADFTGFGHIFKHNEKIYMTAYGTYKGIPTPMIFEYSKERKIKGLITPNGHTPILNETSIIKKGNRFISVMRSQEPSYDMFYSFSDNLEQWSKPRKLGLLGHAPMLTELKNGKTALVFRDLNGDMPGVGLALLDDEMNLQYYNIAKYSGNLYNGGYADLVEIDNNKLFVVYYTCDEDNEPWIEGKIVEL